jgi:magnesium transporter
VRTRLWRNGTLEAEDFPLAKVSDYLAEPDCLVWADIVRPDGAHLAELADELNLDPHAVEDAMSRQERPKAARFPSHLFLTVSPVRLDADCTQLEVGRVSAFTVARGLVTVRLDDVLDINAVVDRWDANDVLLKSGPRGLAHGLLDEIVDGYLDTLETLDDAIDDVEDMLFEDKAQTTTQVSKRTFVIRRALVDSRRAMVPMRDVLNTVRHGITADPHADELTPYYEDLNDHVLHVVDSIETLRDSVTSIFDANMGLSDTRMNVVMKKLTAWAAIIAVPTAVTGYFGQNVPYPGFEQHWGFWLSVAVMVAVAASLYISFKRRDWL